MLKQAPKTVADALNAAQHRLAEAGIDDPRLDARILLQHCLGVDHADLISTQNRALSDEELARYEAKIERRAAREPVSRIIGRRQFFGCWFEVSPHVLDPRPETELLVEAILADYPAAAGAIRFADIGTGSGAIAISLLAERENWTGVGTDISSKALEIAARNAAALGVEKRFQPVECDLTGGLEAPFDFIVSNPPYIESAQIGALSPEVRGHDPAMALDGGADGLEFYRALLAQTASLLANDGRLYLEIGAGQASAVIAIAEETLWRSIRQVNDYGGHVRHLVFDRGGAVAFAS
mgnify:CR=1 FL=1